MTDQQRWDSIGAHGGPAPTPHIDRLVEEGVSFEAYTNSPVCVPARFALATGKYPHNLDVWANGLHTLSSDAPTWSRAIRDDGYATSMVGKTHLHPHREDLAKGEPLLAAIGFDQVDEIAGPRSAVKCESRLTALWREHKVYKAYKTDLADRLRTEPWVPRASPLPLDLYPDSYVGRRACEMIAAHSGPQPWFCWVSFPGPHEPWDAPGEYATMHDPASMPPAIGEPFWRADVPECELDSKEARVARLPADEIARIRANYAGKVSLIDDQIGAIIATVEARGEWDDTVVVLVSDHGEMNGDHRMLYKKNFLDPALRIPFVVRAPRSMGIEPGTRPGSLVELMDVGPTLAEFAGVTPPEGSFARSVLPTLRDPSVVHRAAVLSEYDRETAVVTPEWKMARNARGRPFLLFDRRSDPDECSNLVLDPAHAAALAEMNDLADRLIAASPGSA